MTPSPARGLGSRFGPRIVTAITVVEHSSLWKDPDLGKEGQAGEPSSFIVDADKRERVLLVRGLRTGAFPALPEKKNERQAADRNKAEQPEIIHVGPQRRLLHQHAVDNAQGLRRTQAHVLEVTDHLTIGEIIRRKMPHQHGLVLLRAAGPR